MISYYTLFAIALTPPPHLWFVFQDEVLAISDKVILRADDLLNWMTSDLEWNWGLRTTFNEHSARDSMMTTRFLSKNSSLDFADVDKEKHSG